MPLILTCPQGHQWELAENEPGASSELRVCCPVCGEAVENPRPRAAREGTAPERTLPPHGSPSIGDENEPTVARCFFDSGSAVAPASPVAVATGFPEVPGYELLAELGRGGMGVVYRARQKGLKRHVALKMILGGANASEEQLACFRAEAEAVARLKHPHIVQIYEVGESANLCYFSLEFVEGGQLGRSTQRCSAGAATRRPVC